MPRHALAYDRRQGPASDQDVALVEIFEEEPMPTLTLQLTAEEHSQLEDAAKARQTTVDALAQRWVRDRLIHERERASGGGKDLSPRARRMADEGR